MQKLLCKVSYAQKYQRLKDALMKRKMSNEGIEFEQLQERRLLKMKLGSRSITGEDKDSIKNELLSPQLLSEEQKEFYSTIKQELINKKSTTSE